MDESDHLTLVNAGDEEVVSQEEGGREGSAAGGEVSSAAEQPARRPNAGQHGLGPEVRGSSLQRFSAIWRVIPSVVSLHGMFCLQARVLSGLWTARLEQPEPIFTVRETPARESGELAWSARSF